MPHLRVPPKSAALAGGRKSIRNDDKNAILYTQVLKKYFGARLCGDPCRRAGAWRRRLRHFTMPMSMRRNMLLIKEKIFTMPDAARLRES
jgi:hypothetical protein